MKFENGDIGVTMKDGEKRRSSGHSKSVGAVVNAIKILRYLSRITRPVGVSRVARDLSLNPSTCFNILKTLVAEDFVHFDPSSKTYFIGLGVVNLAKGAETLGSDLVVLRTMMEDIAERYGVTLTLWQRIREDRKMLVYAAHNNNAIRIQMAVGQRLPILHGATGRVMAPTLNLSKKQLSKYFKEIVWSRPISLDEYMKQVEEARLKGWAVDHEHFAAGIVSVAIPLLDSKGMATSACTATMFSGQYSEIETPLVQDLLSIRQRLEPFSSNYFISGT